MKVQSIGKAMCAIVMTAVLALGVTTAGPAGADVGDVLLPKLTLSDQYNQGVCKYKVFWGNYGPAPFAQVRVYNLSACGGLVVAVQYSSGLYTASSTVEATGSDGCGAYQVIQATGPSATAERALVWTGFGAIWYDSNGTVDQPDVEC